MKVKVARSCPTLCDPMDCSPPDSSVHGILQTRILEWVAISFSRGSSRQRDWTWISYIEGRFFTIGATREAHSAMNEPFKRRFKVLTSKLFFLMHHILFIFIYLFLEANYFTILYWFCHTLT